MLRSGWVNRKEVVILLFMSKLKFIQSAIPEGFLFRFMGYQCLIEPEPQLTQSHYLHVQWLLKVYWLSKAFAFPFVKWD